jgi:hypothetical protein
MEAAGTKGTLISNSLREISTLIRKGEVHLGKCKLQNLTNLCRVQSRLPQLYIHLKKYDNLVALAPSLDPFLSNGDCLSGVLGIENVLKYLSKEEIFHFISRDYFSWEEFRKSLLSLTGRYHDTRSLKLFLIFVLLKKENLKDCTRLFYKSYQNVCRLSFNLIDKNIEELFERSESDKYKKIKVIKKRFDFDFSEDLQKQSDVKKNNKVNHGEVNTNKASLEEFHYIEQFIQSSESLSSVVDLLLLNQFYDAADFYFEIIKDKLSKEVRDYYFVEIKRRQGKKDVVAEYIKNEKLLNNENLVLGKFYFRVIKLLNENK